MSYPRVIPFFYANFIRKRPQILMAHDDTQLTLSLPRRTDVDVDVVRRQPSMTRAIVLCSELAGLTNDKDQARAIDIDPTTWSLIRAGTRAFPHDKYERMFDEFGNEAPLFWLADRRGYVLTPKESELEKRLRIEREARIRAEERLAYAESLLTGRAR